MENDIRPISFWQSFLIFGIPGVLIYLSVHYLVPLCTDAGIPLIFSWSASVLIPTIGNAIVIIGLYIREERPDWPTFIARFRLQRLERKYWLWIPFVFVGILLLNESLAWTIPILNNIPFFAPPEIVPEIFKDPYETLAQGRGNATFMGVPLTPVNWWLLPFWLIWVIGGVLGEELVWRGYVLPRQQATYGRWAWLVNGLLWNVPFHWYTLSNVLSDMPLYLILPFFAQRVRNTWFAIIIHAILVALAYVIIIAGILQAR
ncbi:CPBP family intramembrane metalloprotease [Chloroflexi bacterium TSY]|nr:CPBP family intramembrane metalloprotease [Chloroflexi bacterium TSY]